ncbi:Thioredoxin F1 [Abeliophyllum distichum]|uniref:Thioredoxin F1 n=1 Tax=Abeliophyllum distichum TaxID=126358 RepID=A0ABD1VQR8_9LAMI
MSLQVQVYGARPRTSVGSVVQNSTASWSIKQSVGGVTVDYAHVTMKRKLRGQCMGFKVKASFDATGAAASDAVIAPVVLDMYTQWCGPCKAMAPKYRELSEKYLDVVFLKLDCNQENRPLAKELGLRVVPTFKILKDSKVLKEVTGAKFDDLVVAIENARAS